jgi:hypothetical protein
MSFNALAQNDKACEFYKICVTRGKYKTNIVTVQ